MKFPSVLKSQNTILAKYLMRNVLVMLSAVFIVIGLVVFGNQMVLVINESLKEGIPVSDLLPLIGFKMIRDIPLILSLSLFLAIILSVSRLYKDSEAIVMNSIGLGDRQFMLFIQPIAVTIFIFILFLTTYAIPWSKQQRSMIMDRSENASEFSFIKEGEFQEFKNGDIVFYASKVKNTEKSGQQEMEEIFIYTLSSNEPVITLAKQAQKYTDGITNSVYLRLKDGTRYHGFPGDSNKKILNFDLYDLKIIDGGVKKPKDTAVKIESKDTTTLFDSSELKEISELQWRLSQPLSVLILSIFGILLGKASPRGGKNLGVLLGVVVFILYNNALLVAKSSLEQGTTSPTVGLWWVHLLMILIIFIFYFYRHRKFAYYLDKIADRFFSKEESNVK
ncbi:LPS export ABC transporter permease LptF [Candidatus Thioglobus sp.]|jgi:lipopolysaccharide export system permease protein|uniref:LPS export ABC transporter permease LptF n=1 Tax=Candidatus Thioglobus sp. TaxID=2026721 RepID=UPI00177474E6|nr:LPS export ABC transporter permease LptF [Candidatus Thioglobus sp.]